MNSSIFDEPSIFKAFLGISDFAIRLKTTKMKNVRFFDLKTENNAVSTALNVRENQTTKNDLQNNPERPFLTLLDIVIKQR